MRRWASTAAALVPMWESTVELARGIAQGNRRALAKAITLSALYWGDNSLIF